MVRRAHGKANLKFETAIVRYGRTWASQNLLKELRLCFFLGDLIALRQHVCCFVQILVARKVRLTATCVQVCMCRRVFGG